MELARRHGLIVVEDFFVSPILQEAALHVVTSPSWPRHLAQLRATLDERRQAVVAALLRIDGWPTPGVSAGGRDTPLHLWLDVPRGWTSDTLRDVALREGVAIVSGTQWHPSDRSDDHVRLSVAASSTPQIVEGVDRLGRAIERLGP